MYIFHQKVKHIKQKLEIWNKEEFGNIFQGKKEIASQMEQVQQAIIREGLHRTTDKEDKQIQSQINEREKQEELLWKKKSRICLLKEGKKNTKFFHRSIIQ
jgi:hypothetical protein